MYTGGYRVKKDDLAESCPLYLYVSEPVFSAGQHVQGHNAGDSGQNTKGVSNPLPGIDTTIADNCLIALFLYRGINRKRFLEVTNDHSLKQF